SRDRARAVVDAIVGQGIDSGRLVSEGFGQTQPIADNATEAGRASNRRVELRKRGRSAPARPSAGPPCNRHTVTCAAAGGRREAWVSGAGRAQPDLQLKQIAARVALPLCVGM